jgi:hypothetical protein
VERKKDALRELQVQQVCFRHLVGLNHKREAEERQRIQQEKEPPPTPEDGQESNTQQPAQAAETKAPPPNNKIPLRFIVVNTHSSAVIQCNMSCDLSCLIYRSMKLINHRHSGVLCKMVNFTCLTE